MFVCEQPVVSVGNVAQLALDLIISTLDMERFGYLYHEALVPVVGNDPFEDTNKMSCKISSCCEGAFSFNKLYVYGLTYMFMLCMCNVS